MVEFLGGTLYQMGGLAQEGQLAEVIACLNCLPQIREGRKINQNKFGAAWGQVGGQTQHLGEGRGAQEIGPFLFGWAVCSSRS